jgi:hypothetical protein
MDYREKIDYIFQEDDVKRADLAKYGVLQVFKDGKWGDLWGYDPYKHEFVIAKFRENAQLGYSLHWYRNKYPLEDFRVVPYES